MKVNKLENNQNLLFTDNGTLHTVKVNTLSRDKYEKAGTKNLFSSTTRVLCRS